MGYGHPAASREVYYFSPATDGFADGRALGVGVAEHLAGELAVGQLGFLPAANEPYGRNGSAYTQNLV
jgi:hypothetical protein